MDPPVYRKTEEWRNTGTRDVMVFYPTEEEFKDFPAYIAKCERAGAHMASGICKVSPEMLRPRKTGMKMSSDKRTRNLEGFK